MSKQPARPRITEDDTTRAYDIKEWFGLQREYSSGEEHETYDHLYGAAERVYTLLSRLKSYDDLYGKQG